eukprot:7685552-Alexandrium_andersonii.AAC.1
MSASLVGSEMCIRDRQAIPVGSEKLPALPVWVSSGFSGKLLGGSWRGLGCLLYTSDAADDM